MVSPFCVLWSCCCEEDTVSDANFGRACEIVFRAVEVDTLPAHLFLSARAPLRTVGHKT